MSGELQEECDKIDFSVEKFMKRGFAAPKTIDFRIYASSKGRERLMRVEGA